jgi:hypothetical protein
MENEIKYRLQEYLESHYENSKNFVIVDKNIYSKTSISWECLVKINEIIPLRTVYYLSLNSKPYSLGYKIGILLNV